MKRFTLDVDEREFATILIGLNMVAKCPTDLKRAYPDYFPPGINALSEAEIDEMAERLNTAADVRLNHLIGDLTDLDRNELRGTFDDVAEILEAEQDDGNTRQIAFLDRVRAILAGDYHQGLAVAERRILSRAAVRLAYWH